jgi:predicted metal-dependent hydrolase
MKWLVLILIVCVGCAAFRAHQQSVAEAEAVAREEALEEGRRESAARQKEEQERARARRPLMAVSKAVEPLLIAVQGPLNEQEAGDFVPMIELTKQRILDKRVHAEAERQPVYDCATVVMDLLTALAEERTSFLINMLRNRASASTSLDRPNGGTTSSFFNQNTAKRWNETVTRTRPTILQAMEQLRAAERQWNKQLDPARETESYDVANFGPLLIPAEQVSQNSLSPAAISATRAAATPTRIWRSSYYNTYGYRYPYSSTYPVFP